MEPIRLKVSKHARSNEYLLTRQLISLDDNRSPANPANCVDERSEVRTMVLPPSAEKRGER